MRNFFVTNLLLIGFIILLTGCSSKIDGEVFIVTKGGEAKKLALIDVKAYKILDEISFKKSLIANFSTFAKLESNHPDDKFYSRTLPKVLNDLTKDMEAIKTQSDADGKFQLSIPNGNYLIFAVGGRQALNEDYIWLMKNPKNGKLRLANDTMYDQFCELCLLSPDDFKEILTIATSAQAAEAERVAKAAVEAMAEQTAKMERDEKAEQDSYEIKSCNELKSMAKAYPNSIYAGKIEKIIIRRWGSSICP